MAGVSGSGPMAGVSGCYITQEHAPGVVNPAQPMVDGDDAFILPEEQIAGVAAVEDGHMHGAPLFAASCWDS